MKSSGNGTLVSLWKKEMFLLGSNAEDNYCGFDEVDDYDTLNCTLEDSSLNVREDVVASLPRVRSKVKRNYCSWICEQLFTYSYFNLFVYCPRLDYQMIFSKISMCNRSKFIINSRNKMSRNLPDLKWTCYIIEWFDLSLTHFVSTSFHPISTGTDPSLWWRLWGGVVKGSSPVV